MMSKGEALLYIIYFLQREGHLFSKVFAIWQCSFVFVNQR